MRTRFFSMITALCMAVSAIPVFSLNAHAAGSGTAEDPFLIYTAANLVTFAERVNAGSTGYCGKLMANINLSSISNWTPIAQSNGYTGTFDGAGHTITGLKINTSTTANLGLFGIINGGTVKNVAVTGANIVNSYSMTETRTSNVYCPRGYITLGAYIGPEALRSTFQSFVGRTAYMNAYHGDDGWGWDSNGGDDVGIGPLEWAKVKIHSWGWDSYWDDNYGWYDEDFDEIEYDGYVVGKGLSARHYGAELNTGGYFPFTTSYTASGPQSNTGGIAAVMNSGLIEGCSFSGTVNSNYARAGGLVGWQRGGTLSKCYSTGSVNGTYSAGGVGVLDGGTVVNCYSTAYSTQYTKTATIYSSSITQPYLVSSKTYSSPVYMDGDGWVDFGTANSAPAAYDVTTKKHVSDNANNHYSGDYYKSEVINESYGALFRVDAYNYTASVANWSAVTHQGYTNGFACAVNGGTIQKAYYFNESSYGKAFSGNNGYAASTYSLAYGKTTNANSASLTKTDYANETNFSGWDFDETWTISPTLGRPVLYSMAGAESITLVKVQPPQGGDSLFRVYADNPNTVTFDLSRYVKLSSGESTSGKFTYTVNSGDAATVTGDAFVVKANLARGDYTVSMTGHDPKGKFKDFPVTITVRAVTRVFEPVAEESGFPYTRQKHLSDIGLTADGWEWADGTIIPINDYDGGYDAIYKFEDESYLYDWSAVPQAVYDAAANKLTAKVQVLVYASAESPWATYITITDSDTGEPVKGATVTHEDDFEFPFGHETGDDGRVYGQITSGEHTITVTEDGYEPQETEITIHPNNGNEVTISITPTRFDLKLPKVRTLDGADVEGARVTALKTSANKTMAWNYGDNALEDAAEKELPFPKGSFTFSNATPGYTAKNEVYAEISADGAITYYDGDKNEISADDFIIYVDTLSDPMYHVTIKRDNPESMEYTAEVTLENITATYGTFGLKYDAGLFTLKESDVTLADDLTKQFTPGEMYGKDWSSSEGWYMFVWQAGGYDGTEFNTISGEKPVATFKFTINDVSRAGEITNETFSVMQWHRMREARTWAEENLTDDLPEHAPLKYFSEYWRYCDEENNPENLGTGRLAAEKAVVNGITGGFYQASVNGGIGGTVSSTLYDVRTTIDYDFDIDYTALKIHVIDDDTGEDIENADVRLYEDGIRMLDEKTNYLGEVGYATDKNGAQTYAYTVSKNGYYPVPESGYAEDRPTVTTVIKESTEVTVRLKKKIYHVPETKQENIAVGGEKYGYNGEDYTFRIEAAPGYRITKYPTAAKVSVGDYTSIAAEYDAATETFKLAGNYLDQRELTVEEMNNLGYQNVADPQPDEEGYRSYNIIVEFESCAAESVAYEVSALTNDGGIVTYDPQGGLAAKVNTDHEKRITTTSESRKTGVFTFAAEETHKVAKVFINGLQIHTYDGLTGFTYTFGEVDMDNNITVFFTKTDDETGEEKPPDDTLMTLVVGEYGYANVTSPESRANVTATRRTYVNETTPLTFTARGMDGYVLAGIDLAENGGVAEAQTIYPDDVTHSYTFEPPEADSGGTKTVYVTFVNKDAPPGEDGEDPETPTVFVKAYVYSGRGVIDHAGILIYNKGDTPTFTMTGETDGNWRVRGAVISPYDDIENGSEVEFADKPPEKVYTMAPLTEDTAIGAIFAEKGYLLQGKVDLSQGSTLTKGKPITGATVTFTQTNADGTAMDAAAVYKTKTTAHRTDAVFTEELPPGTWTVTVTKQGYVKRTITLFTMEIPENPDDVTYFGDLGGGEMKKITPYIGSTRTGTSVTLLDAAVIKASGREGASDADMRAADVDNDGAVRVYDMAYVMFNYGVRAKTETYSDFLTSPQPETP